MDLEKFLDSFMMLIKIGKKEHMEDLQKGKLYMNRIKFFNDQEKIHGDRNVGDKNDGRFLLGRGEFQLKDCKSGKVFASGKMENLSLLFEESDNIPTLCFYSVDKRNHIKTEKDEDIIHIFYRLKDEDYSKLIELHGEEAFVLIINYSEFMEKVRSACEEKKLRLSYSPISYTDLLKPSPLDLKKLQEKNPLTAIYRKDIFYAHQQEFRITLPDERVQDYFILEIGEIFKLTKLVPIKALKTMKLEMLCPYFEEDENTKR